MRTRVLIAAALVALFCFVSPVVAEKGDMKVQFGALYSAPTDQLEDLSDGDVTEADAALGFQVSFEYMVTDKIGIEPALASVSHDVEIEEIGTDFELDSGEIDYMALTANVNFHVLSSDKIDIYVGPTIGYVFWGDLELELLGQFSTDDEFTFGANFGLDVPFGEKWAFSAGLSYLFVDVSAGGPEDIPIDPVQAKVGLAYKF